MDIYFCTEISVNTSGRGLISVLHVNLHALLHGQGQRDLICDVLTRHQLEFVSFDKEGHSNKSFQSSQVLTKANTGSSMECRPLSLRFTAEIALCSNPSFRLKFSCVRAPHLGTPSLSIRTYSMIVNVIFLNAYGHVRSLLTPHDIVSLANMGTIGPNIVVECILLIVGYGRI